MTDRRGPSADDVLETIPDAFVAVDPEGRVVAWNGAAEELSGWSAAEVMGRPVEELAAGEGDQHWLLLTRSWLASTGRAEVLKEHRVLTVRHRDGRQLPVEMVLSTVQGAMGPIACGFVRDISTRVAAESALATERNFVEALLDSLDASVLVLDAQGRPRNASSDAALPAGWSTLDLAETTAGLYHPAGQPLTVAESPVTRAFAGEVVRNLELVARPPGGPVTVLSANGRPILDAEGNRFGAVVVAHDVTDLRRAERLHACDLAVTRILTRAGGLAEIAAAVLERVCHTVDAGRAEFRLIDPVGGADGVTAAWPVAPASAGPVAPASAGPVAPASAGPGGAGPGGPPPGVTVSLISDRTAIGSIRLYGWTPREPEMTFLEGIATQLALFVERRRAEQLAMELARTKDEFIALAGHTLRTPLTTIVSLTDLLLTAGEDLVVEREALLSRVRANAQTLRDIVEDLLDLAGLESGHINLRLGAIDLADLIDAAVAAAAPVAAAAGVRLELERPAELTLTGDRWRLRQAVDNLLSNAVKYSPGGGVVRVCLRAEETVVDLTVTDEGMGVADHERERLFNRFFRGTVAHERGIPGTGLGLALTRLIVELHGGTILLTDRDQPGASFTLRLPRTPGRNP